jgi:hypothetical protein
VSTVAYVARSASATPRPDTRDTSASADGPPHTTATVGRALLLITAPVARTRTAEGRPSACSAALPRDAPSSRATRVQTGSMVSRWPFRSWMERIWAPFGLVTSAPARHASCLASGSGEDSARNGRDNCCGPGHAAGYATTLCSNTTTAGSLVAGIVAGATAQALGYRAALQFCGLLSAVAWVLLVVPAHREQPLPAPARDRRHGDAGPATRGRPPRIPFPRREGGQGRTGGTLETVAAAATAGLNIP